MPIFRIGAGTTIAAAMLVGALLSTFPLPAAHAQQAATTDQAHACDRSHRRQNWKPATTRIRPTPAARRLATT